MKYVNNIRRVVRRNNVIAIISPVVIPTLIVVGIPSIKVVYRGHSPYKKNKAQYINYNHVDGVNQYTFFIVADDRLVGVTIEKQKQKEEGV